jgi:hypothetical protein
MTAGKVFAYHAEHFFAEQQQSTSNFAASCD